MSIAISGGINTAALQRFIRKLSACAQPRGFRLYCRGETASVVYPPFRADEGMHLYSLSKSFTSVCVGIAQDMGLLSVEERMLDIFPDLAPETVSDNLAAMRLCDVLSMQSGHDRCHLDAMRFSENAVKTFLAMPVVYRPGTTFVYSTGGTAVCGAAVERRAGMPLREFMDLYLLRPLEIENRKPVCCADGTHCGGVGMFVSVDELYRFGKMLLQNGVWEGKRIVSESYLRAATSPVADNSMNGTHDWTAGYGFQFWRNDRAGFRGDGAYGQFCIVVPEMDAVLVLEECTGELQHVVDLIFELLEDVCGPETLKIPLSELEAEVNAVYPASPCPLPEERAYVFADNPSGIRSGEVLRENGGIRLRLETDYGTQSILAGNGEWTDSGPMFRFLKPGLLSLDPRFGRIEQFRLRSCLCKDGEGTYILSKHTDSPHTQIFRLLPDGIRITADGELAESARFLKVR